MVPPFWLVCAILGLGGPALCLAGSASAAEAVGPSFELASMTYVGSRGAENEIVLDAGRARYWPQRERVQLEQMRASLAAMAGVPGFEMTCDRGLLDLAKSDFQAVGNVRGRTRDGRRIRTDRLRYDHETGVVSTAEPVVITDGTGTYRGGGFLYYVREGRFKLLGGAEVIQEP